MTDTPTTRPDANAAYYAEHARAAEHRQAAAQQGRDTTPPATPDTGLVER